VPTATVSSPPPTAASRIATPNGRLQCQPKKAKGVDSVFWAMKISSKIRVRKPAINADHRAPARVNLTAGSPGDGPAWGAGGGGLGEAEGVLLMITSLPHPPQKETRNAGNLALPAQAQQRVVVSDISVSGMGMLWRGRGRSAIIRAAVLLTTVCLAAACSNSDPLGTETRNMRSIVVGSGDFPESEIIAEIYAQTLEANGFDIGRRMGIGSRETYVPALKDHSIDLVPEYIGNLLQYFAPTSTATMLDAAELELYKRLPGDLSILTPSPASDTDTVTVTSGTATSWNLKTIADLAGHSADVTFAAPSNFQTRPSGLPGLKRKYGLNISPGNFIAIEDGGGAVTVRALLQGRVDAANIFSTSPAIPQNQLVVLEDPEHNFLAGNIVPLVNSQKKSDHLKDVLDAVSAKLSSSVVAALNATVEGNSGIDPGQAARNWVRYNRFDHPIGQ
jgi:osmoprotectant transport system substrate-binding protein